MTPVEQALAYAERWPVFPTALVRRSNGAVDKVPLVKWAKAAADRAAVDARDPALIRRWWARWPHALISMPTGPRSGLIVLDIDVKPPRPGKPWAYGWDTLADLGGAILPETPMAHTPSAGTHIYFRHNPAIAIGNSQGGKGLGPGLDVRGDGGAIVLPGPGGYKWDPHWNFETVEPVPVPRWLGHREKRPSSTSRSGGFDPQSILREACDNIRAAAAGERHEVLNREAYSIAGLVGAGVLDQATARHELQAAALAMAARSGGDRGKAADDLADAFADGLRAPRRARR
jgi:putative DNA primase/helicase